MKIVVATPLYPPEVGGPSYYAQGLEEAFKKAGHEVDIAAFGGVRKFPSGIRHFAYFFRVLEEMKGAHATIALDTASVAWPAWLASKIRRVPFVVRTGGDFLWEHYLERTGNLVPLPFFYTQPRDLSLKEQVVYALTRLILRRSTVVFSTRMQKDIWIYPYGLDAKRTLVIKNAVDAPLPSEKPARKNFLWYVRPNAIKNAANVRAAFAKAREKFPEIELEEGNAPKAQLLERMKSSWAVLLPSITEISPNYILDALRFRKPFILDKYSGFAQWLSPYGEIVDPLDVDDIARAIENLASENGHDEALERAAKFSYVRTYDDIAKEFLALIETL